MPGTSLYVVWIVNDSHNKLVEQRMAEFGVNKKRSW